MSAPHGEEGASLLIAMAFLALFGLVIASLLAESSVNFRTTSVVRARDAKLYAADAGLEYGVQQARSNDAVCPNVANPQQTITSTLSVNSRTVAVFCQAVAGRLASPLQPGASQGYAVITTAVGSSVSTTGTGTASISVAGGDVSYSTAPVLGDSLAVTQGDAVQRSCPGAQPPQLSVGAPDLWSCGPAAVPDVPHALPTAAPALRANPTILACGVIPSLTIFHPGKYLPGDVLDFGLYNYFESGVYYFEDLPMSFLGKVVVGGQPVPSESTILNALPAGCANDHIPGDPSSATGNGVTFILGGSSYISMNDLGLGLTKFELYTRVPASSDGSTPGVSIIAVPSAAPAGYKAWTGPSVFGDSSLGKAGVAVHGLVYSPTGPVAVYANSAINAPMLGGVVASTLTIQPLPGAIGTLAGVSAQGRRTLLLTSIALGTAPGEIATAEQAIVKIANDPARTATVRSWRTL